MNEIEEAVCPHHYWIDEKSNVRNEEKYLHKGLRGA
jgi:hypothetical protein